MLEPAGRVLRDPGDGDLPGLDGNGGVVVRRFVPAGPLVPGVGPLVGVVLVEADGRSLVDDQLRVAGADRLTDRGQWMAL